MSGILDNKSRVLDTIITLEGKKQITNAELRVQYVSFTDGATYYQADIASGSSDATERIYLESCHLPQDQITFEADDSGRLQPFRNGDGITVKDGQILTYSFDALTASVLEGSNQNMTLLRGDEFASAAGNLLASSIDNFSKLRLIGTKDRIFEDDGFGVGNSQIEFTIHDDKPIADPANSMGHVNHMESIFQDVRFSKLDNFKYLPPINKVDDASVDKRDHRNTWQKQLGNYMPWGRSHIYGLSPQQLEFELQHYEQMGYAKTIVFDPTSLSNNLVGQFFEVNFNNMRKLDVIDYGPYVWQGNKRHAFFAGRIMFDDTGSPTFIHLFTLVFG